ncbi:ATPase inhibitor mai-2, mitochondrial [Echinococcus granulosus]|uniref:ATP synthase F1 subunit epsilon n=1 Tax=Echinococcus granulosus TaxID=6210 RepID=A0A068WV27_ECHGR|nr:ATPase inhibitor mai-2, mitochondrial [Echinococcus granulosus]CDS21480.1 atpase inhibitor protein [Echinococcus granulosus]
MPLRTTCGVANASSLHPLVCWLYTRVLWFRFCVFRSGNMLTSGFAFIPAFLRRANPKSIDILKPVVIGCYRMYPGDELGRGVSKGGGKGGPVRDAGGSFGKREAALEEEYFHRKDLEQIKELKKHLVAEVKFHEEQIERHKEALRRSLEQLEEID